MRRILIAIVALLPMVAHAANELEHIDTSGLTIYAKPTPIVASPWGDDDVTLAEVGTTGYYAGDVASPTTSYVVYQQAGGSPASTDTKVAIIAMGFADVRLWDGGSIDTLITEADITSAVWDADATTYQTAGTFGEALGDPLATGNSIRDMIGVGGAALTAIDLPNQTMDIVGSITGNLSGSVGSLTGHTVQTGDSYARIGAAGAGLTDITLNAASIDLVWDEPKADHVGATTFGDIPTDINAVLEDTGTTLPASLAAIDVLIDSIIAEVVTASGEPAQGAPPASASMQVKVNWLYKAFRNKVTQTATTYSIYNDAGNVVDAKATTSDDGTTYQRTEIETGP